ncbi:PI-PLC domain-containing protein [Streptomyces sp. MMS21 TC-5]|uniref:PI-PLC domain-containing protein n=1 Tax=Streptomyces sp. MMS21 TC-5 TaxID=2925833 RepID=UPI001F61BE16|nr:PI-PLC domain-containing protein [Streptomyces sp. MMS21 TC-5]MCI4085001.1 PI-PLC domain-containing protein [Streptomyces sp. MMS21 TC-5]
MIDMDMLRLWFRGRLRGALRRGHARRTAACLLLLALLGTATTTTTATATTASPPSTASTASTTAARSPGAPADLAAARWGDRRLDEVSFLTTHNAFTNYEDSRWSSVNQSESVRAQLDGGVRGLSLDTHWYERSTWLCVISFGSDCYPSDVYLCHGDCKTFAGATYALPRQSFHGTMQTVVDFLAAHPQEVVTVFLEDYVSADQLSRSLGRVRGLSDMVFRPDEWGVRQNGWPKVADLVTSGKRLLIFSDRSDREHLGVMYDRSWTVSNYWSLGDLGNDTSCVTRWPDVPLDRQEPGFRRLFTMSHHRNVPTVLTAALDNGAKLRNRIAGQCWPAAGGRDPNYVSVDFHRLSDSSGHTPASIVAELNAGP